MSYCKIEFFGAQHFCYASCLPRHHCNDFELMTSPACTTKWSVLHDNIYVYIYIYKLIHILYKCVCVCARCHTAKLRYQLYLMFSNFLIYPSCYFRFAFVCVDQPQTQTVVYTHTCKHIHTVPTENKHFQRNKKHRKNDKH